MKERLKTAVRPAGAAALIWAVLLPVVTSGNIRMDVDRMIRTPETAMDQYVREGRAALVWVLRLFGLAEWHPVRCGLLFLLFLTLSCGMLFFALRRLTGWKDRHLCLFLLLYGLSPIWAFHGYFVLQIAAIGLGMAIATGTACADSLLFRKGSGRPATFIAWGIVSTAALSFSLLIYQALILCYTAAALILLCAFFLRENRISVPAACLMIGRAAAATAAYIILSQVFRAGADAGNMEVQIRWGNTPALQCLGRIAQEIGAVLVMYTSRYFSLYTFGTALLIVFIIRRKRSGQPVNAGMVVCSAGLLAAPFALSFLLGNVTVPRSQFALQAAAAFLPVLFIAGTEGRHRFVRAVCVAAVILQALLTVRLWHTDNIRNAQDTGTAQTIAAELADADPAKPLIFIGVRRMEGNHLLTEKTDVYGRSFFEWLYKEETPGSASQGAVRLLNAVTGTSRVRDTSPEENARAAEMAEEMPVYPEEGFVREADRFIVIRLSE